MLSALHKSAETACIWIANISRSSRRTRAASLWLLFLLPHKARSWGVQVNGCDCRGSVRCRMRNDQPSDELTFSLF